MTLVFPLLACQGSIELDKNIDTQLPVYSEEVERGCNSPLLLPEKNLTKFEVEKYWSADRAALVSCRNLQTITKVPLNELREQFSGERTAPRPNPLFRNDK